MQTDKRKLPLSPAGRLILVLLTFDASLVGIIISAISRSSLALIICIIVLFISGAVLSVTLIDRIRREQGQGILYAFGRAIWLTAATLFWAVAAGLLLIGFGYAAALIFPAAMPLLVYTLAFVSIVVMTWSTAKTSIRHRRMLLILSNVEKSIRLGLPLPRMIHAAAQGETGLMRKRLLALHDHLDRGEPLDQALVNSVPEVTYPTIRLIAAGEQMHCLERVLDGILRRRQDDNGISASPRPGFYLAYPVIILVVMSLIFVFVMPKFQAIFRDFKVELPPPTRQIIIFFETSTFLQVLICAIALAPLGKALSSLFPSFRNIAPFGGEFADQLIWWTPVFGRYVSDRGMADLCDIISAGVSGGHPLDDTLRQAAAAQPNSVLRYRAIAWAQAVNEGKAMHEAARYARMPVLFTSMLATVRDSDSLIQVLAFLWRYYEYRVNRTRAVVQALYVPMIVLALGTLVALVGASLISPMAVLTDHYARMILSGGF